MRADPLAVTDKKPALPPAEWAIFTGIFAVGIAWTVMAKSFSVGPVITTIVPVALMAFYIANLRAQGRLLTDERSGDNVYYLGLLFTLTSLAAALYQWEQGSEQIANIISKFGIALATTIVGMVARVIIQMHRLDFQDAEESAQAGLIRASDEFRTTLTQATESFSTLSTTFRQQMDEHFLGLKATLDAQATGAFTLFTAAVGSAGTKLSQTAIVTEQAMRRSVEAVEQAAARLTQAIDQQSGALGASLEEMKGLSTKISQSVGRFVGKLDAIDIDPDLFSRKLDQSFGGLNEVVKTLHETLTNVQVVQSGHVGTSQRLAESMKAVVTTVQNLPSLATQLGALSVTLNTVQIGLDAASSGLSKSMQLIKILGDATESETKRIEESRRRLEATLSKLELDVDRTASALGSLANTVVERLGAGRK